MNSQQNRKGHILAFITIVIWGTTYISTKVLLQSFAPVEILFIRFVIGLFALCIICPHRMKIERKHEIYFVLAGLSGITLYYLFENIALVYTQATNVGVIISVAPFFTAILAHIFLKEKKITRNFILGFIMAMLGICLISYNGSIAFALNPLGDLLALLAAVVWSVYSIVTRKIAEFHYDTIQTTRRTFLYGIIFMIPALFIFGFHPVYTRLLQPVVLLNILFLGFCACALCFVTWNMAVKILGAVKTSIYIYLVPVITIVTSVFILHEKMNAMSVIGVLCTLTGLFLSGKGKENKGRNRNESF